MRLCLVFGSHSNVSLYIRFPIVVNSSFTQERNFHLVKAGHYSLDSMVKKKIRIQSTFDVMSLPIRLLQNARVFSFSSNQRLQQFSGYFRYISDYFSFHAGVEFFLTFFLMFFFSIRDLYHTAITFLQIAGEMELQIVFFYCPIGVIICSN